ncbi:class I SAM-dependent methyltransferase [Actinoplanes sichuanensis]|uniref:Class I SAM-dependent methyltransferase n=1 Tax=Actinoplanes sichuanensis TaxID=512349 RepID=A0ABW4AQ09_9ACTN|nr:class I SAM-dependent methyltransferase [Actinoplanes sichuanensis]BEL05012.1 class I SAM-dependent methyltransferase [Actinoplanes sichuanensis]
MKVFGSVAAAYAEHRPDYPADAVRWVLAAAPGVRVLDLGAGTGKLTAALLQVGASVTAVEPDPAMRAVLDETFPQVQTLPGSAESIAVPDATVDAIVAGNAMHWFDMTAAEPEFTRVLAPGGVTAGLWNVLDDSVGWVAELARVAGAAVVGPRDTPDAWRAATAGMLGAAAQARAFPHGQRRTADSLVATLATRAGVLIMPEPQRAMLLARIRDFLASRPETATGEFTLPMLTMVLRR